MAECEAVDHAINHAVPDSLIVLLTENIKKVIECVIQHQKKNKEQNQQ